ncbi:hypothetical protein AK812_SmicGene18462 [Symbiodinium microadriaticum]|uniref:Endonuclease/exonuclease/phosphatase domain-containing protein n=1 Tax=Symbiodinium microadriaticum TaxID=2951 RepID=A0A1Q9DV15_SYMMI|nr:hypothetical protein AK812_SmicGene18462 [Symbiodinium microadriaticum]
MRTVLFVDLLLAAAVSHNTSVRGHFVHAATAIGRDEDDVSHKIRILNWNILAPSWDNNVGKKDKSAQWPFRLPKLMHEMRLRKPDIIVLQEEESYFLCRPKVEVILWEEQIKPFLKSHGFQSAYASCQRACSESGMGIAVLWRHSRFDLGNTVEVGLGPERPTLVDLGDASNSRWLAQKRGSLNKDQQSRFFSKGYIVANPISLLPMRLDIQAVQTLMLMDSMERVLEHENWEPGVGRLQEEASESVPFEIPSEVVVAGDFNVPPYYPQMSFDLLSKHIAQEGDFDQMATTVMFLGSTSRTVTRFVEREKAKTSEILAGWYTDVVDYCKDKPNLKRKYMYNTKKFQYWVESSWTGTEVPPEAAAALPDVGDLGSWDQDEQNTKPEDEKAKRMEEEEELGETIEKAMSDLLARIAKLHDTTSKLRPPNNPEPTDTHERPQIRDIEKSNKNRLSGPKIPVPKNAAKAAAKGKARAKK